MTRTPWTTVEQRSWLEERKSRWLEATAAGQTKSLRPQLLAEWYAAFPLEAPTPKEVQEAGGDDQMVKQLKRQKTDEVRHLLTSLRLEANPCIEGYSVVLQQDPGT